MSPFGTDPRIITALALNYQATDDDVIRAINENQQALAEMSHVLAKIARDLGMSTMAAPGHIYAKVKQVIEKAQAADALSKSMGG